MTETTVYEAARIPFLTMASNPLLTAQGLRWTFRGSPSDIAYGQLTAGYMALQLAAKRIAIVVPPALGLKKAFGHVPGGGRASPPGAPVEALNLVGGAELRLRIAKRGIFLGQTRAGRPSGPVTECRDRTSGGAFAVDERTAEEQHQAQRSRLSGKSRSNGTCRPMTYGRGDYHEVASMARPMTIEGEVVLDEPASLAAATLRVTLQDVSMADAPAQTIAVSERTVSGRAVQMLPFRLELPLPPTAGRRCTLAAEIRAQGHARVEAGDFLNTVAVPWAPVERRRTRWTIPVRRIKA